MKRSSWGQFIFIMGIPILVRWHPCIKTSPSYLTHWGWVMHICISKLTIVSPDNGLSPGRHQAIIWTIAGILLIGPLGINFGEILIKIHKFSFKKIHLQMSSANCRPFCLGLNVLMYMPADDLAHKEPRHQQAWYWPSLPREVLINSLLYGKLKKIFLIGSSTSIGTADALVPNNNRTSAPTVLSYIITSADDLATQGARASAAMILA